MMMAFLSQTAGLGQRGLLLAFVSVLAWQAHCVSAYQTYVAINAGGLGVGGDPAFLSDYYSTGGLISTSSAAVDTSKVFFPPAQAMYQSQRYSTDATGFTYAPNGLTPNTNYQVKLHFVETYFTAAGLRKFNCAIQGVSKLTNYDIFASAGAMNKAVTQTFVVNSGADIGGGAKITIAFTPGSVNNPTLAGFEVSSYTTSLALNTGGGATGSFASDTFVSGGTVSNSAVAVDTSGVMNPGTSSMYQSQKWGTMTYTIPNLFPNRPYSVKFHFAEATYTAVHARQFNVAIDGVGLLSDYDIFAQAGGANIAIAERFTVTSAASGTMTITFTVGSADQPCLGGLEIAIDDTIATPRSKVMISLYANALTTMTDMETNFGQRIGVATYFSKWDSTQQTNAFTQARTYWDAGKVPELTWEPWIPNKVDVCASIAAGEQDTYINQFLTGTTSGINTLKQFVSGPDGILGNFDDRKMYIRFMHEMSGSWYPWAADNRQIAPSSTVGLQKTTTANYIAAWRKVYNMVRVTAGLDADHVQFIWAPDTSDSGRPSQFYWPGAAYIDWVGMDRYNWGNSPNVGFTPTWQSPVSLFNTYIDNLYTETFCPSFLVAGVQQTCPSRTGISAKPLSIAETACASWNGATTYPWAKNTWVKEFMDFVSTKVAPGGQRIRKITIFNTVKETDWGFVIPASDPQALGTNTDDFTGVSGTAYKVYRAFKQGLTSPNFYGADVVSSPRAVNDDLISLVQFKGQY